MDNLKPYDFNDLQALWLDGSEMSEARGLKSAGLCNADHGTRDPLTITVSETVVVIPTASVETSDTKALEKQDSITTTPWMEELLISDNVMKGKVAVMLAHKQRKHFAMAYKTVRSGRIHATLFNNESAAMRQSCLRHQEHRQGSDSIAITSAGC